MDFVHNYGFLPLDEEEAEIMKSLENNDWKPMPKEEKEQFLAALKKGVESRFQKTKPVSFRFYEPVLYGLKVKAKETGLSYQTIVQLLAKQYVDGKIELKI